MITCPVQPKDKITDGKVCDKDSCWNYVPTLEYNCLPLHCSIFNLKPIEVLTNLYKKPLKMEMALAIKATRVAFAVKELVHRNEVLRGFEKEWYGKIESAGPLPPNLHWTVMVDENKNYKIVDRMAQVLNTMDIHEYSLRLIAEKYKELFHSIDLVALAISKDDKAEFENFLLGDE